MKNDMYVKIVAAVLPILVANGCFSLGCASLNPTPPVETLTKAMVDKAIVPAIEKGLAQGITQLQMQASAQGINPKYVIRFDGKWVVGIEGQASIGVEGIAGQIMVAAAGNEDTRKSPYQTEEPPPPATTQPASLGTMEGDYDLIDNDDDPAPEVATHTMTVSPEGR